MTAIIDEVGSDQSHFEFETGSSPDEGIFIRTVASLILSLADVIHVTMSNRVNLNAPYAPHIWDSYTTDLDVLTSVRSLLGPRF